MNPATKAGLILLLVSLSACHVGPQIKDLDVANNPAGANVEVRVSPAGGQGTLEFEGELLGINEDGIVFSGTRDDKATYEIIFVAWSRAGKLTATELSGYTAKIGQNGEWSEKTKERFRLISRFPQGISPEIMNGLLAANRQVELRRFEL